MNTVNTIQDTILATSDYYHEFSLAASANKIFATAKLYRLAGIYEIYLQQLEINRKSPESFEISYSQPDKKGVLIGKERSTGFQGTSIYYDNPRLATDGLGNALFYIREYYRFLRVSPIVNGTELAWGAMGRPIGLGIFNNGLYTTERPFAVTSKDGTGVIAWDDTRNVGSNSYDNIFTRHLDNLYDNNYYPPLRKIKALSPGNNTTLPIILLGTSKRWSTIDGYTTAGRNSYTPIAQVMDNFNLGATEVNIFQNTSAIRTNNGKAYLDRNYTIKPENDPGGSVSIPVQLYFTTSEFEALKNADPSILDPGSLVVIKQTNATGVAPATYAPVAGESTIIPTSWQSVTGGYYLEFAVNSFSNFFIQGKASPVPVTWLGIQAEWVNKNDVKVSWQVVAQINVKKYNLQHSEDGTRFTNVCEVAATNSEYYDCIVAAENGRTHYYRVLQTDFDERSSLSKVVTLTSFSDPAITIYPNPVVDEIKLTGPGSYSEFNISNIAGKTMIRGKVNGRPQSISVRNLQPGTYVLKLSGSAGLQVLKFVKQ